MASTTSVGVFEDYTQKKSQYLLRLLGLKKKFHIFNHSEYDCKIVVSPGEITNLSCIKLGPAEFTMTYDTPGESTQDTNLLANSMRKIYTSTRDSYITVFVRVEDKWIILFKNKRHSVSKDFNIFARHIEEAMLNVHS